MGEFAMPQMVIAVCFSSSEEAVERAIARTSSVSMSFHPRESAGFMLPVHVCRTRASTIRGQLVRVAQRPFRTQHRPSMRRAFRPLLPNGSIVPLDICPGDGKTTWAVPFLANGPSTMLQTSARLSDGEIVLSKSQV